MWGGSNPATHAYIQTPPKSRPLPHPPPPPSGHLLHGAGPAPEHPPLAEPANAEWCRGGGGKLHTRARPAGGGQCGKDSVQLVTRTTVTLEDEPGNLKIGRAGWGWEGPGRLRHGWVGRGGWAGGGRPVGRGGSGGPGAGGAARGRESRGGAVAQVDDGRHDVAGLEAGRPRVGHRPGPVVHVPQVTVIPRLPPTASSPPSPGISPPPPQPPAAGPPAPPRPSQHGQPYRIPSLLAALRRHGGRRGSDLLCDHGGANDPEYAFRVAPATVSSVCLSVCLSISVKLYARRKTVSSSLPAPPPFSHCAAPCLRCPGASTRGAPRPRPDGRSPPAPPPPSANIALTGRRRR